MIKRLIVILTAIVAINNNCMAFQRESKGFISVNLGVADNNLKRTYTQTGTTNATYSFSGTTYNPVLEAQLGYYILDELRVSINPVYIDSKISRKSEKSSIATVNGVTSKYLVNNIGLFGNVTYDILTGSALNPFINAGIGILRTKIDDKFSYQGLSYKADKTTNKTAYKIGAGLAYHISSTSDVEFSYNLINQIKRKNKKYANYNFSGTNYSAEGDLRMIQTFTVGLRYTF